MNDFAARKAQLIAQSELDRMRLSHAVLTTRRSLSPTALLSSGGAGVRSFAGEMLAFGLPLFARRSGVLRIAAFALAAFRTIRRVMRR